MRISYLLPACCRTVFALVGSLLGAQLSLAMDIVVTSNADSGNGTLRQALQFNTALGGNNTILFSNSVASPIVLTSGELVITTNVTIVGPGPDVLTISGNSANRVFNVSGGTVAIAGLTIANGRLSGDGAGVYNLSTLSASNCFFTGNTSLVGNGGAIRSSGNLTVDRCAFAANNSYSGAALWLAGSALINNCTIVSNSAGLNGGGIYSASSNNVIITSCTISSNLAGGISLPNTGGGGIGGSAMVRNSICAGNSTQSRGPDAYGTFTSGGYNLIGNTVDSSGWGGLGDQLGTAASPINPDLLPLGIYGGPTPTMPPDLDSPALDQGNNFGVSADQRGRTRPITNVVNSIPFGGDHSDIGAVELGRITLVVSNSNDNGPGSLRQAVIDASHADRDVVTFASNVTNAIVLTSGEIVLNKNIFISGPTTRALAVSGNNSNRVFHVIGGVEPFIQSLTITKGMATTNGGGILVDASYLYLSNCQIVSNAVTAFLGAGGGLCALGNSYLSLVNCSVTHNEANFSGGGIAQSGAAAVSISVSTIAGNRTTYAYDGLFQPNGGGIAAPSGFLFVTASTIASNTSTYAGGGICNGVFSSSYVIIDDSIIAGNTAAGVAPDFYGQADSDGYNLLGNSSGSLGFTNIGDQLNLDPLLGPLANYGGPTLTMALRSGSPAIDKGKSGGADQRGIARPVDDPAIANASGGNGVDIGAFEVDSNLRIVDLRRVGSDVALSMMTVLGKNYRADYMNNLASGAWTTFTNNVPGNGWLTWVTNSGGANQPSRFYRGAILP